MGRELQKRKNRSSTPRVRKKPKSKKKILSNHIIAENWDQSLTLTQNYQRIGLTEKLNKRTGGVERKPGEEKHDDPLSIEGKRRKANEVLDVREAKIQRDPRTGAILSILDDGEEKRPNPLNDPLNDLDSESDDDMEESFDQHGSVYPTASQNGTQPKTDVVARLEDEASRPAPKYQRKQSEGEIAFIEELVRKHGDDYGAMARDMKVNYMQRSEGDLKKRVKKWRERGGKV
ncbi:Ribosome biogenesis protein Nop16 [Saxophila tyrrhenica]|uniref:Nucleolar protein 16 n=1 Tax=Saxophila tyrrhenica TaxID=1690608 RepID=A0AAV9PAF9_9PEZI|nr:Ribosome biogenesis protein Nop16 [Saxophila tyrrhenica]